MMVAVTDTTVLSNFANIQQPAWLAAAFEHSVTVAPVLVELAQGVERARLPSVDWTWLPVIELTERECERADRLGTTLGRGEAACIALAQARGWMVLTDDRDARRVAQSLGVAVSGTLGALMNLVRAKVLSLADADQSLDLMKQYGYRCPVNSLSELEGR